jgi:hypothetical protein
MSSMWGDKPEQVGGLMTVQSSASPGRNIAFLSFRKPRVLSRGQNFGFPDLPEKDTPRVLVIVPKVRFSLHLTKPKFLAVAKTLAFQTTGKTSIFYRPAKLRLFSGTRNLEFSATGKTCVFPPTQNSDVFVGLTKPVFPHRPKTPAFWRVGKNPLFDGRQKPQVFSGWLNMGFRGGPKLEQFWLTGKTQPSSFGQPRQPHFCRWPKTLSFDQGAKLQLFEGRQNPNFSLTAENSVFQQRMKTQLLADRPKPKFSLRHLTMSFRQGQKLQVSSSRQNSEFSATLQNHVFLAAPKTSDFRRSHKPRLWPRCETVKFHLACENAVFDQEKGTPCS